MSERGSSSSNRRRRKRRSGSESFGTGRALRIGFFVVAALVGVLATLLLLVYPSRKGPGAGKAATFEIVGGESSFVLGERLAAAGFVESPRIFALYAMSQGGTKGLAPGVHFLVDDVSPGEVLKRLQRFGMAERIKVVFPEGYTRFDMARRLEEKHVCSADAFLASTVKPELLRELGLVDSAEGFLFPATYDFVADSDPDDLVRRLKTELDKRLAQIELGHSMSRAQLASQLGFGTREIVTLASIVEKEAVVDEERPIIASVFLNRLRDPSFKKKVLQSDPTAGYGCLVLRDKVPACAGYTGKITHDINAATENTYSTYTHEGLPPGPICNPGVKSLSAAFQPSTTRYLYFVARGGGRHAFSETYDEHNAAIKESNARRTPP
jgi:UPF0755 protein